MTNLFGFLQEATAVLLPVIKVEAVASLNQHPSPLRIPTRSFCWPPILRLLRLERPQWRNPSWKNRPRRSLKVNVSTPNFCLIIAQEEIITLPATILFSTWTIVPSTTNNRPQTMPPLIIAEGTRTLPRSTHPGHLKDWCILPVVLSRYSKTFSIIWILKVWGFQNCNLMAMIMVVTSANPLFCISAYSISPTE